MAKKPKPRKVRGDAKATDEQIAHALKTFDGRQMHAADALGICGATLSQRIHKSPFLQQVLQDARERRLDNFEAVLERLGKQDSLGAACFVLKTLGKHRGYVETQPIIVSQDIIKNLEDLKSDIRAAQVNRKKADKNNNSE